MNTIKQKKEVFDPIQQKVIQKTTNRKEYAPLADFVCTKCGASQSKFLNEKDVKRDTMKCGTCGSTKFHKVTQFSTDTVNEVMNRQLLYVALDGMEFTDKLACEAYNSYLMGDTVEADKCPRCGALHMVKNVDRKSCDNCSLSSQYFKRGFLKKSANLVFPHGNL